MYSSKGPVPEGEYTIPLGLADIKRNGSDVTICCFSKTVPTSLRAAEQLAELGISAEVIDLRSIRPLDRDTIFESVKKTNHVLVVQEAWPQASVGSWLASVIQEEMFDYLDAPIKVLSGRDCSYPYARSLEKMMAPNPDTVLNTVRQLLR
jgi:pyruvate dehydrogenase E1 component beta subunit